MFVTLHPEELNEHHKNWLAIAICGAIIADGNIAVEEIRYLEKALSFLPSQTKIDALIQAVKNQKLPPIEKMNGASRELETQIFLELTSVMSSDNCLSTREMDYLFKIGKKLGFGKEYVRIVLRWANEGVAWRKKMTHLVKAGSDLEADYE